LDFLPVDYFQFAICKMKKKSIDLKSLWDRAAKTRKVELASTSIPEQVAVTSVVGSADQPQELVPSIVLETNESQVHNESIPSIEEQQHNREPEVASNDPNTTTTTVGEQQQHRVVELTEPSTWSPIIDGDDSGDESSDEAIYDIDLLSHDPRKRIPIKRYNVNERNYVIKAFIALGPCQPWNHDFPTRYIGGKPRRFLPD
jgi:hypothetical protein